MALTVLAVALGAALRAAGVATRNASDLKLRMLAQWVAQDRIAQATLDQARPASEVREGSALQAGIRFRWRERFGATPNPVFRRIEISVRAVDQPEYELARVVTYVPRPPAP